jgi:hypothetical protein
VSKANVHDGSSMDLILYGPESFYSMEKGYREILTKYDYENVKEQNNNQLKISGFKCPPLIFVMFIERISIYAERFFSN